MPGVPGGRYRARHTEECRKRFEELIGQTEHGKQRFEAAAERKNKATLKEDEEEKRPQGEELEVEDKQAAQGELASGSGLAESQRQESVEAQNDREMEKALDESVPTARRSRKKKQRSEHKEFQPTAPRDRTRCGEVEEEPEEEGCGPHGSEMPMSPKLAIGGGEAQESQPATAPEAAMEATRPGKRAAEDNADDSERLQRGTKECGDVAGCTSVLQRV